MMDNTLGLMRLSAFDVMMQIKIFNNWASKIKIYLIENKRKLTASSFCLFEKLCSNWISTYPRVLYGIILICGKLKLVQVDIAIEM